MSNVTCTIDGRQVTVPAGTNVIEAAKSLHVEVPHYCYHRNLSVAGNCRMCLVKIGTPKRGPDGQVVKNAEGKPEIGFIPKLQIGCATPVTEGMVIETSSNEVQTARKGVMEFLLINHPLDCPICDQAGECRLQEFAVDHGGGESRFVELKVRKPKHRPLGEKIMLDNERCIMCSRCERFMREVAGQDCLGFSQRGSHVELTCYPGNEPKTNYDLNLVDICPVGALTSKDFRFRMRPWFMKETRSICNGCSRGCNMTIWTRDREVYRQTPRDNDDVNKSWMCDEGRMTYRHLNESNRTSAPQLRSSRGAALGDATWPAAIMAATDALKANKGSVAIIGSARSSTEELYLLNKLAKHVGATLVDCVPREAKADHLLHTADGNPNAAGAALVGFTSGPIGSKLPGLVQAVKSGQVKTLLIVGEEAAAAGLTSADLERVESVIVLSPTVSDTTAAATVVLPTATYAERSGTYVNIQNRMQRFSAALPPPGEAQADYNVLSALLAELGVVDEADSFAELFERMAKEIPAIASLTWNAIGDLGVDLTVKPASLPASTAAAEVSP